MDVPRKKNTSQPHTARLSKTIIIDPNSDDDISSDSASQIPTMRRNLRRLINKPPKHKEIVVQSSREEEEEQVSCVDLMNTSQTIRSGFEQKTFVKKAEGFYMEVMVKNPDYTNKKKLAKDQSTLDSFITDFRESKYLKANKIKGNKYRQLTIFDFKKGERREEVS